MPQINTTLRRRQLNDLEFVKAKIMLAVFEDERILLDPDLIRVNKVTTRHSHEVDVLNHGGCFGPRRVSYQEEMVAVEIDWE